MLVIGPLLALQCITMHIENHVVDFCGIALNLRNNRMDAHDTVTSVSSNHVRI